MCRKTALHAAICISIIMTFALVYSGYVELKGIICGMIIAYLFYIIKEGGDK